MIHLVVSLRSIVIHGALLMCSIENTRNYSVMAHTQVNFSISPRPEIGFLLLELAVRVGKSGKPGM